MPAILEQTITATAPQKTSARTTLRRHPTNGQLVSPFAPGPSHTDDAVTPATIINATQLRTLDLRYNAQDRILWCQFRFSGRPCFSEAMLEDFAAVRQMLHRIFAVAKEEIPVRIVALTSPLPGVWNLGGDLDLFVRLIRERNRDRLLAYARAATESGYHYTTSFGLPLLTVSVVQGDALGGGFEAALSSNVIIAERGAKFGLPEVLFNLFPGMGAYSFLGRRVAPGFAERMILSGSVYTAEQLYDMGVVDHLAEEGAGVAALYDLFERGPSRLNTWRAVIEARRIVQPVHLEELHAIARVWTDLALELTDADLRRMVRLVGAQDKRLARIDA
ncbi:MAG TPA: crotonase/enoyl-CoA hydratase family protein [Azospirillum sp.]|nr:crotonase/enoyl-CoA hydratase family protein [Azospirillum sp.]